MRILLVEDEEEFALFAKKGFEAKGFAVDVATSGEAGLQKARLNPYSAIVLDMSLPGTLQGPAVLKDLREFKPSIPILMISGVCKDVATKVEMLDRCDDYLCKGELAMEELIARLYAIMRRPAVQHQARPQGGRSRSRSACLYSEAGWQTGQVAPQTVCSAPIPDA